MTNYTSTEISNQGAAHEFKVVIPFSVIENNITAEAEKLKDEITIAGFRKGKAPLSYIKQKHGPALLQDSIETCFHDTVKSLFAEKNIKPAFEPKYDIKEFKNGEDFEFTISVEARPNFNIPEFNTFTVTKYKVDITDFSLDKELEHFKQEMREATEITDKKYKLKTGDIAVINFLGKVDGEAFNGGTAEDYELELGSKSFIDNFEDQIVGKKLGDSFDVNVNFPEEYHAENLKGKAAVFEVTIKAIKAKGEVSELNDELVAKLNIPSITTIEQLKQDISKKLEKEFVTSSYHLVKKDLFDQLEQYFDQELPPTLVSQEIEQVKKADPSLNDKTEEAEKLAKRRVALSLLFIDLADQQNIKLTENDYRTAIMDIASKYPGAEMQIVDLYMKNKHLIESLQGNILEDKVVSWILKHVKFNEVAIKDEKFIDLLK